MSCSKVRVNVLAYYGWMGPHAHILLPYNLTTLLPYCLTTLLPYNLTALQPYCLTTLQPYCLTTLLPYNLATDPVLTAFYINRCLLEALTTSQRYVYGCYLTIHYICVFLTVLGSQAFNLKKYMSICVSSKCSAYQKSIHAATGAEIIYSIDHGDSTVYALVHKNPGKRHANIDKGIVLVDSIVSKAGSTSFLSISTICSCKVKTFQAGEHALDEHYNLIFSNKVPTGKQNVLCPGVKTWTPDLARDEEKQAQALRHVEDLEVQQQAMEEDPAAFGMASGSVQLPLSNKRHADPQSLQPDQAKKHQEVHVLNQQTLDCYFKGTDDKLDKIHIDNVETAKSTSKCLLEINDNVVKNHIVSSAKLDDVTQLVIDSHTKIDSMNKTVTDFVEQQDDLSALIYSRDHYEKMYHKVRATLAANATRENKPIHAELAESKAREANMTLQLADLNQIGTDIMSIDAFMGEKDERDKRVEQDIAKLKAALSSLEERDKRVEQDITKLKAGQSEIKQMLAILLSKA